MYGGEVQCTVGRYSVRWRGTVYGGEVQCTVERYSVRWGEGGAMT